MIPTRFPLLVSVSFVVTESQRSGSTGPVNVSGEGPRKGPSGDGQGHLTVGDKIPVNGDCETEKRPTLG